MRCAAEHTVSGYSAGVKLGACDGWGKPLSFRRRTGAMRSRGDTAAAYFLRLVPGRRCNARPNAFRIVKSYARVVYRLACFVALDAAFLPDRMSYNAAGIPGGTAPL